MSAAKSGTRSHDVKPTGAIYDFMATGWAPSPIENLVRAEVADYTKARRAALSKLFRGRTLIIPAGSLKVRSNDCDYRFRPHSAFAWLTGITSSDSVPDSVLVMVPNARGHEATLFVHPRSPRSEGDFFTNARYGEFWVGRRLTLGETKKRYGLTAVHLRELPDFLKSNRGALLLRGEDSDCDRAVTKDKRHEAELAIALSELRLAKDDFEIAELQLAVDSTHLGFNEMLAKLPAAVKAQRGERLLEGSFFSRARIDGNELGYDSIVAAGAHACILHWIKNDGQVRKGDLILIDAGIERESFYTADITRTVPVNGKFTRAQKRIYQLVLDAQKAAMLEVKPGNDFLAPHRAAQVVLARGLADLGVLPVSAEQSLQPDSGLHRRWTIHGTSHMLGIDVHDCAHAREDHYRAGKLGVGQVITVEPGLYIQPDDLLFPAEYRGIGVRIEDDVLVTASGSRNLSAGIPSEIKDVENWVKSALA